MLLGWPMSGIRPWFLGCLGARWPPMRGAVADCTSVQVPALCERAEPVIVPSIAGYAAGAGTAWVGYWEPGIGCGAGCRARSSSVRDLLPSSRGRLVHRWPSFGQDGLWPAGPLSG